MKIDPIQLLQSIAPLNPPKAKSSSDTSNFATLLDQQLQQASTQAVAAPSTMQSTSMIPLIESSDADVLTATNSLLTAMEHYQQTLADLNATLREVAPKAQRMQIEVDGLTSLLDTWPSDHPVRSVVEQTMATAHQEIMMFNNGYYIEE